MRWKALTLGYVLNTHITFSQRTFSHVRTTQTDKTAWGILIYMGLEALLQPEKAIFSILFWKIFENNKNMPSIGVLKLETR